ncbi:MAG: response regulator transcription factor [Sphingobacteriales bacterium]|nr:MAG: response regulator transcription factor [Sphingobacteriales bacterium]
MHTYNLAIRYNNLAFRIAGSLVVSIFITLFGTGSNFFIALKYPSFYLVVGLSFLVALLLTYCVHCITIQLDKHFDWRRNPYRRAGLQLSVGVLVPVVLAYYIMMLYFRFVDGRDIHDSQYMLIDFPHMVYFIIILNLYYVIHYLVVELMVMYHLWQNELRTKEKEPVLMAAIGGEEDPGPIHEQQLVINEEVKSLQAQKEEDEAVLPNSEAPEGTIMVNGGLDTLTLDVLQEVCYFYRSGRSNWVVTFSGNRYLVSKTLKEFEAIYCGPHLFRINRGVIVNRAALLQYEEGKHRRLLLKLKPGYEKFCSGEDFVTVSQRNYSLFKSWFDHKPVFNG